MRFDSTPYYHVGEDYSWQTLVREMREEVRLMDQGGFTGLWLAEHHFAWDGWYRAPTDPILVGADLIAESDRMRVGQCGAIIPDWNPIRVAEDIAILDQLTKGRVDFGAGRGINTRSTIQFFKEADRRDPERNRALFREALEIIVRALENDAFSYKGEFYTYPTPGWYESNPLVRDPKYHADDGELIALGVTPRPYQQPRPPVYIMAETVGSFGYAGEKGYSAMCASLSPGRINEAFTAHKEAASQRLGRSVPTGEDVAVMRPTFVAETYEEAVQAVRPGANRLAAWSSVNPHKARQATLIEEEMEEGDLDSDWFDFQLKHDLILVGSPDSVSEQIERIQSKTGCQHIALFLNFPGLSFQQVMNSLHLFSDRIIPRFA